MSSNQTTTSIERAEQLWDTLHQCFVDAQATMAVIIAERAWEPLGYKSFAKAWNARMGDVSLAAEMRPAVVYQLLSEGVTPQRIATMISGVSVGLAELLQREMDNGVPPELGSRKNPCKPLTPSPFVTLFIRCPRNTLDALRGMALARGTKLDDLALSLLVAELERYREQVA